MARASLLIAGALLAFLYSSAAVEPGPAPTLILISIDGWRWDYLRLHGAPNIRKLAARGVTAEALVPSFPSKTFPNHYTLVTGLRPGRHGIIANTMRDPSTGRLFTLSDRREVANPDWWGGEPIWSAVQQQRGQKSASIFWPGSEAPIGGRHPDYWLPLDDAMPGDERVDRILDWLDRPIADRPVFLSLYFSEVDTAGHRFGPASAETRAAVRRVDGYLGRLVRGLARRKVDRLVNLVLVSDHGMASTDDAQRVVVIDDYISADDVEIVDLNPTLGLIPKPGKGDAVYAALVSAHPRLHVYRKADSPGHWYYREHPRVPPIVGVVDDGWQVLRRSTVVQRHSGVVAASKGEHGYDPETSASMRGLFIAAGPAFKTAARIGLLDNISVYNILAHALGVSPAPNQGQPAVETGVLR
jgi:predicted AlkP superfamily pyrophosphatase or phosphodiesterase